MTKYLPELKSIEILNYHQVNCMRMLLVGPEKSEIREVSFNNDPDNTTRATLALVGTGGYNKYYLIQEYNSSFNICMNYLWEAPDLPNLLSQ